MSDTITGAIIGAAGAIVVGGLISWYNKYQDQKKDKRAIIAEIMGLTFFQYRLLNSVIGHQTWFNYYEREKQLEGNGFTGDSLIAFRTERLTNIETALIENDSKLITLSARYLYYFSNDLTFKQKMDSITQYNMADHIEYEFFLEWKPEQFSDVNARRNICISMDTPIKQLDDSFKIIVDEFKTLLENQLNKL